jgi:glycosyltransferase involved in cell wall biosynthesis
MGGAVGNPDVTIIVTTFNRADWLLVSLYSILASAANGQRAGIATRVIVVDDGSEGHATREVAARAGVDYLRVPNRGRGTPSFGRVAGLDSADSPFVAFFDDDDVMLPRWVQLHVARIREGHDVCSTAFWWTDADLAPTRLVALPLVTMGDLLVGRFAINDQSLVRRSVLAESDLDPELENVMLADLWLGTAYRGHSFTQLDEATFLHRRHESNTSDHLSPRDAETRRIVIERYRELVLTRDGQVPPPTPLPAVAPKVRPRRSRWRSAAARFRRVLRGRSSADADGAAPGGQPRT